MGAKVGEGLGTGFRVMIGLNDEFSSPKLASLYPVTSLYDVLDDRKSDRLIPSISWLELFLWC